MTRRGSRLIESLTGKDHSYARDALTAVNERPAGSGFDAATVEIVGASARENARVVHFRAAGMNMRRITGAARAAALSAPPLLPS